MADKTAPSSVDSRPDVPDTKTPLTATGADYYPRLQETVNDARVALKKKTKRDYSEFTAVEFIKSGKDYWVKVQVGGDQYVHIFIRRSAGSSKLQGYRLDKTASDPLESFL